MLVQAFRKVRRQPLNLGIGHIARQKAASAVQSKVLLVQNAGKACEGGRRVHLFGQQVQNFVHALVTHVLKEHQARNLGLTPIIVRHGVWRDLNEWALSFQEELFVLAVIDDHVWIGARDNLVIVGLIVPDVQLNHLNGVFFDFRLHPVLAVKIEIDVAVHGWINLAQDDPVDAVWRVSLNMLRGCNALNNALALGVFVKTSKQIGFSYVVALDKRFLPIKVGNVFPQNAKTAGVNVIGMNGPIGHYQLDERRIINHRPGQRGVEHLVCVGIVPLVVQRLFEARNIPVLVFVSRSAQID